MNPRRKTYIAHLTKGTAFPSPKPFEVLAFSPEDARAWLTRSGWTVHSVAPKPRRKAAASWVLDPAALDAVKDFYGLQFPVYITKSATKTSAGWHQFCFGWQLPQSAPAALRRETFVHRVNVDTRQSPREASRTIWHELCHAWQAESDLAPSGHPWERVRPLLARQKREHRLPHGKRPIEIEAASYEQHADEIMPALPLSSRA